MARSQMQSRTARPLLPDTYTREGGETRVKRRTPLYELNLWLRTNDSIELAAIIDSPKAMGFYLEVYGQFFLF